MFKKLIMIGAIAALPITAHANTFMDRLERPLAGDVNFICSTNPNIFVSYYIDPASGETWTKFWEETVINTNPYTSQWINIEVEVPGEARRGQVRRKCGFSPQELRWLKSIAPKPFISTPNIGARSSSVPRLR